MDFRQIARDVRANALVALAVLLLCVAVGLAAAELPKPQYKATVTLLAQPSGDALNAIPVIQFVVPQLPTLVENPSTIAAARSQVPAGLQDRPVSVSATGDQGTGVLTVSVTSPSAAAAAAYANAVSARVIAVQPKGTASFYQLVELSPARPPTAPDNPKKPILAGAAGFGVIAAIFAAMGAAGVRRRLSRADEVRDRAGTTVLAEIPRLRGSRPKLSPFVTGSDPLAVESFQELRSSLLLLQQDARPLVVAVTSSDPGEGKTSVAANLAWVLASADQPVTALDADLRRPMLHRELGVNLAPGLSSWDPHRPLEEVVQRAQNPSLEVVAAGVPDRHPSDVVSSVLPPVLRQLREAGRMVVVDCPPVLGIAETVLIAGLVDMVVVVVDGRRLRPERLQQTIFRLDRTSAVLAGVVVNRARFARRRTGAYGYSYDDTSRSARHRRTAGRRSLAIGQRPEAAENPPLADPPPPPVRPMTVRAGSGSHGGSTIKARPPGSAGRELRGPAPPPSRSDRVAGPPDAGHDRA